MEAGPTGCANQHKTNSIGWKRRACHPDPLKGFEEGKLVVQRRKQVIDHVGLAERATMRTIGGGICTVLWEHGHSMKSVTEN